jgi:hypothetical protein
MAGYGTLSAMQALKITVGPKRRRQMMRLMVVAIAATAVVALLFLQLLHRGWASLVVGACLAVFMVYYFSVLATSYTECTPEHIRTRRLGPPRVTPWSQVRNIDQYANNTGRGIVYNVQVTTTAGRSYWLGGISTTASGGKDGDPEFAGQLEQVVDYWRAAAPAQPALD